MWPVPSFLIGLLLKYMGYQVLLVPTLCLAHVTCTIRDVMVSLGARRQFQYRNAGGPVVVGDFTVGTRSSNSTHVLVT